MDVGYWAGHVKNRLGKKEFVEVGRIGCQRMGRLGKKEVGH